MYSHGITSQVICIQLVDGAVISTECVHEMERERTAFSYSFDPEKHVRRPVQRNDNDDRLPRAKRQRTRSRKKTVATVRSNRPYSDVLGMNLQCCTENTCLLNHGREVITAIRDQFDRKLYDQQNTSLSSLIDVEVRNQRKRITYNIRDASGLRKVKVCKTAFMKIFGIGKKRVAILFKKIQPYSGHVEEDQRRNNRNQKKIPLVLKAEVKNT